MNISDKVYVKVAKENFKGIEKVTEKIVLIDI